MPSPVPMGMPTAGNPTPAPAPAAAPIAIHHHSKGRFLVSLMDVMMHEGPSGDKSAEANGIRSAESIRTIANRQRPPRLYRA